MKEQIKNNWKSGITVALISLPLSIALAVASQTTPIVGIITAMWAGIVASFFGGSNYNIIGPTGALSGILASYALEHGAVTLSMLAIISGIFIIIAYFLHLERYLIFIPASIIHGFTLGIAILIMLTQLNNAFGLTHPSMYDSVIQNAIHSLCSIASLSVPTFLLFLISLLFLCIWGNKVSFIPGAIVLTPISIFIGYISTHIFSYPLNTLESKFGILCPVLFIAPHLSLTISLFSTGLIVAFIAILETMISARIADGITKTKHKKRQEMLGLGLANMASGVMGGMPATAALARTSLNIKSGATKKISATIAAIFIAIISLLLLPYFQYLPLAVIAALLTYVALNMIEREHFIRMFHIDSTNFYLSLTVAIITLVFDPIIAILIGITLSLIIFMQRISIGHYEMKVHAPEKQEAQTKPTEYSENKTLIYTFKGTLSYINGQAHIARFENQPLIWNTIVLDFKDTFFIDIDGVDTIEEIVELLHQRKKKVVITDLNPFIKKMLLTSKSVKALKKNGLIFPTVNDALQIYRDGQYTEIRHNV